MCQDAPPPPAEPTKVQVYPLKVQHCPDPRCTHNEPRIRHRFQGSWNCISSMGPKKQDFLILCNYIHYHTASLNLSAMHSYFPTDFSYFYNSHKLLSLGKTVNGGWEVGTGGFTKLGKQTNWKTISSARAWKMEDPHFIATLILPDKLNYPVNPFRRNENRERCFTPHLEGSTKALLFSIESPRPPAIPKPTTKTRIVSY